MTKDKKKKRAVRSRMAKTGEAYATAHRQMVGTEASPAPPPSPWRPGDDEGRYLLDKATRTPASLPPFARHADPDELALGFIETVRPAPYDWSTEPSLGYVVVRRFKFDALIVKLDGHRHRYVVRSRDLGYWSMYSFDIFDLANVKSLIAKGNPWSLDPFPAPATLGRTKPPYLFDDVCDSIPSRRTGRVTLFGSEDAEFGPYARWEEVNEADAESRLSSGWRRPTDAEKEAAIGEIEDFTEDWKHSDWAD